MKHYKANFNIYLMSKLNMYISYKIYYLPYGALPLVVL